MEELKEIRRFNAPIEHISIPDAFTFPFYYEPHPLTKLAVEQLQDALMTYEFNYDFGLKDQSNEKAVGKMFGVLVVRDEIGQLGFLSAFSGKLGDELLIDGFVPPVFNYLDKEGFYIKGELQLIQWNKKISKIESDKSYVEAQNLLAKAKEKFNSDMAVLKKSFSDSRKARRKIRKAAKQEMSEIEYAVLHDEHRKQSYLQQKEMAMRKETQAVEIKPLEAQCEKFVHRLSEFKEQRKRLSQTLQSKLHDQYVMLNAHGIKKPLLDIFKDSDLSFPSSGAGECAAPKLLQYAFSNLLEPICMGEFWWGRSPNAEVRKHGFYYPSCRSKCAPILGHMLDGLNVEDNPLLKKVLQKRDIEVLYEDEYFAVINKPEGMLSVPGKASDYSVYLEMKMKYPDATGPLIVHRLDMATSGIMLIAKSKLAHSELQNLFLKKKISKRYVAWLEGVCEKDEGEVSLPLRVDLDDRPRQVVCYEYGKQANTRWKVIGRTTNRTKVYFYPVTGRTHQLRVHAAHANGLNLPIVGDQLYGQLDDRLNLHANQISFTHPFSGKEVSYESEPDF